MVARAAARGLDVHLVVAGRRSLMTPEHGRALDEAIAAASAPGAPLAGRLHLLGALPDVQPVYGASDDVVLLSHVEGLFPLMLVEAMGHGVPVVTTDVGGIGDCLTDARDAAVVKKVPDDALDPTPEVLAEFERRLDAVLSDSAERGRLGEAGRRRVEALVLENDFHGDTRAAYDRALSLGRMRR
jgi:glycosyltransferase involved in cell wall biosynthesis